jgi:hypothetical protein
MKQKSTKKRAKTSTKPIEKEYSKLFNGNDPLRFEWAKDGDVFQQFSTYKHYPPSKTSFNSTSK